MITGIPIDDELAQLLSRIVPYHADGENPLPEEKRFLFNLNKLLNEDLAAQSDQYKLAACKLALRQALAINKTVDSIEVRRYASATNGVNGSYSGKYGLEVKGNFLWILGGHIETLTQWNNSDYQLEPLTNQLFVLGDGKIRNVTVCASVGSCGGMFTDCCADYPYPPGLDDAWFQNFIDIERVADFPFDSSMYSPKIVEYMVEKSLELKEELALQGYRLAPEYVANLARLKNLNHLMIDLSSAKDAGAMRDAFFDLFPKLPKLQTIEMNSGQVTEVQMQKLAKCQNLTHLTLTNFSAATPKVFAPINRMKQLEKLVIQPKIAQLPLFSWAYDYRCTYDAVYWDKTKPNQEIVRFHDLPNLSHLQIAVECPLSLTNLPNLTLLVTNAPKLEGDIFTGRTPPNLKTLSCAGLEITEEQIRHIATLQQLEYLSLLRLDPKNLDVFSPLKDAKNLKHLALVFTGVNKFQNNRYDNMTLAIPPLELKALHVRFPYEGQYLAVRIPKLAKNYCLNVENVLFVDDIPPFPGQVYCWKSKMSYAQFQQAFQHGDGSGKDEYSHLFFGVFTLTDIDEDDLFVDFNFPSSLRIQFNDSTKMNEALKGKTLHFENSDRLRQLSLSGIPLGETDIRLSGLTKMTGFQINE
jgi:Leucine-rich repeat (LRR) protein